MTYSADFFANRSGATIASARQIIPWVLARIDVDSVVDVGCGTGIWLTEFIQNGINDVIGLDGPWVPLDHLSITPEQFVAVDFTQLTSLNLRRRFDLAICLEVAEHIPSSQAPEFVQCLVEFSPCILFSAAIPKQGGVGHYNEQWPEYWIDQFRRHNYLCVDVVRGAFWDNAKVSHWYPQNAFFFIANGTTSNYPRLMADANLNSLAFKAIIHPRQYLQRIQELSDPRNYSIRSIVRYMPYFVKHALRRRLGL